jgi:hypothetical protein
MSEEIMRHRLDDPDWEIVPSDEPTNLWLPIMGIVVFLLIWGSVFAWHYFTKPEPKPQAQECKTDMRNGWTVCRTL